MEDDMLVDELLAEGGGDGADAQQQDRRPAAKGKGGQKQASRRPAEDLARGMGALKVGPQGAIVVLPGDRVTEHVTAAALKLTLGTGLAQRGDDVFATRAGTLRHAPPRTWWVEGNQRRYIPKCEDHVLGIIEDRSGDYYRVNIFGPSAALLPLLAFDGATRRNKPNLKPGAIVYCRVASANNASAPRFPEHCDMEPELSCEAAGHALKKDWMTRQGTFGELMGGMYARCSLMQARRLMQPDCAVLSALGAELAFEIAIGENGAFWVNSAGGAPATTVIINAIRNAEHHPVEQHALIVRANLATMRAKFGSGRQGSE
ncbi:hypothetical protein JKP88DRAFT_329403 [Tribonema minus]|uniref:Ribosomal RNA-processing protein 40 n=1 Tax=Tribonema minus TaxID=303371 RepID=A0A835YY15_9STRA|nr:hypothetical protein JKP88DRAFT_329403 [Tribonema minus]